MALAAGEVEENQLSDDVVCKDWSLQSGVASTSAGIELMCNEVMVIGNSEAWGGELVVGHSVMQDAIDRDAVREAIVNAGISFDWALSPEERGANRQRLCEMRSLPRRPGAGPQAHDAR